MLKEIFSMYAHLYYSQYKQDIKLENIKKYTLKRAFFF